jgi:hypothetical protein
MVSAERQFCDSFYRLKTVMNSLRRMFGKSSVIRSKDASPVSRLAAERC